jgi:hypothetical protein
MEKKRLKKDLPGFKVGTVFVKCNNRYEISRGEVIYNGNLFASSSNGIYMTEPKETELINELWNNEKWLEDADFSRAQWNVKDNIISITFEKDVDPEDLLTVAKIIHKVLSENFKETTEDMGYKGAAFLNIF